jgi:TP901 family phage tail tape measure protein
MRLAKATFPRPCKTSLISLKMADTKNRIVVILEAEIAELQKNLGKAEAALQSAGKRMQDIGGALSTSVTLPVAALGVTILKTAGDFEASMNEIRAITNVTANDLEILRQKNLELGASTQFSAQQSANAMSNLIKNGLTVGQVMGGALDSTLKLASATGTNLENAANIASDALGQFSLKASDLGKVVDQLSGLTIASKFGIDDVRLALAQAGGVAGAVGVSFTDFATSIAATSSAFASGADAGTSFKTFLTSLNPKSKEAAATMRQLGLNFFSATGEMLPMRDIAEQLQRSFAGLSEKQKLQSAETLFGADAMRTGLMFAKAGAKGFDEYAASIDKVSASEQAAIRMQGFNGAIATLSSSFEALQLSIANSGLLEFATNLANGAANLLQKLSTLNPEILRIGTIIAGVAAAAGPLLFVFGKLATLGGTVAGVIATGAGAFMGMAKAVALLSLKFITITAIIAAAIAAIVTIGVAIKSAYDTFETFRTVVDFLGNTVSSVFSKVKDAFISFFKTATSVLKPIIDLHIQAARAIGLIGEATGQSSGKVVQEAAKMEAALEKSSGESYAENFKKNFAGVVDFISEGAKSVKKTVSDMLFVKPQNLGQLSSQGGQATGSAPAAGPATGLAEATQKAAVEADKLKQIFAKIDAELAGIQARKLIFPDFDAAKANALRSGLENLADAGVSKSDAALQKYLATWQQTDAAIKAAALDQKINKTFTDAQAGVALADAKFKEFGGTMQGLAEEKINIVKTAMTSLLAEGIAPTDERFLKLRETLTLLNEQLAAVPTQTEMAKTAMQSLVADVQKGQFSFDNLGLAIAKSMSQLGQEVAQGGKDLRGFAQSAVQSIRRVISGFIAQGVAAVVSKTLISTGIGGPAAVALAGIAGALASSLFNSIIPRFADGGIVSGPTLGLMGEYPGARSNPEVIAPLSKLQSMLDIGGGPGMDSAPIVEAIKSNPPTVVNIDKDGFSTSIQRAMQRTQIINRRFSWSSK